MHGQGVVDDYKEQASRAPHREEEEIKEVPTEPPSAHRGAAALPTAPPQSGRAQTARLGLPRQQSLTRRGQSFPAASSPSNDPSTRPFSPVIRDTRTPDHESRLWPISDDSSVTLPPPFRGSQLRAGVVKRTEAGERWKSLRGSYLRRDDDDQAGTLVKRQMQLKDTMHVNQELKQAIYDQWTLKPPPNKSHGIMDELVNWEVCVKTRVQKLIQNAVAVVKGHRQTTTQSSDLAIKSGFVLSQRKGLFGAKTVRHYVQLSADGTFVMRKTEQPNSPVIVALNVKDVEIENDPDCDLTLRLTPIESSRFVLGNITPRRLLGPASHQRAVTFTLNDPATKEGWLKAFSIQKRMTTEEASVQKRVASFAAQFKSSTDHSAVSRATAGLIKGHQRMRSSADNVPPIALKHATSDGESIAPDAFCSVPKRATSDGESIHTSSGELLSEATPGMRFSESAHVLSAR
jgi:hypothetical protein